MIPFEEIDIRLEKLGKDRAWLARETPYSSDYLRTVLAKNSTRRTERVQSVISDAIEREESLQEAAQAQAVEALKQHAITIYPTREQFNRWTSAFKHSDADTMEEWAEIGLDDLAAEWEQSRFKPLRVASRVASFDISLWHAAAGQPLIPESPYP